MGLCQHGQERRMKLQIKTHVASNHDPYEEFATGLLKFVFSVVLGAIALGSLLSIRIG
jgi:hypothetical protein